MLRRGAVVLAVTVVLCCTGPSGAFTIDMEPGERACFSLVVTKGTPCSGNFELIEPDNNVGALSVEVTTPSSGGAAVPPAYEARGEAEGTFAFEANEDGEMRLCLSNGHDGTDGGDSNGDGVARTVGFAFRANNDLSADLSSDVATEEHVVALFELGTEFSEGLATMLDHQSYMRQREERHRDITESTNSRVLYWTVAEAVVLLIMALWQVLYIRKFFEVKRYV